MYKAVVGYVQMCAKEQLKQHTTEFAWKNPKQHQQSKNSQAPQHSPRFCLSRLLRKAEHKTNTKINRADSKHEFLFKAK